MTAPEHMQMPGADELLVPQELTLSTPWLKTIAVYMGIRCQREMNEFMLLRREFGNDPRKVLKEGREVTACGVNFVRELRRTCLKEASEYANCLDHSQGGEMLPIYCRQKQYPLDRCVEDKLGIRRPQIGHFSKLHVHDSKVQPPQLKYSRDYQAEAAKMMVELPQDWPIEMKKYRKFRPYVLSWPGYE